MRLTQRLTLSLAHTSSRAAQQRRCRRQRARRLAAIPLLSTQPRLLHPPLRSLRHQREWIVRRRLVGSRSARSLSRLSPPPPHATLSSATAAPSCGRRRIPLQQPPWPRTRSCARHLMAMRQLPRLPMMRCLPTSDAMHQWLRRWALLVSARTTAERQVAPLTRWVSIPCLRRPTQYRSASLSGERVDRSLASRQTTLGISSLA